MNPILIAMLAHWWRWDLWFGRPTSPKEPD